MHTPTHLFPDDKLQFLKRLAILVFHLLSLSMAVYCRPANMDAPLLQWPTEIREIIRTVSECCVVLSVLGYILIQLGGEMINVGLLSFLKQLVGLQIYLFCVIIPQTFNLPFIVRPRDRVARKMSEIVHSGKINYMKIKVFKADCTENADMTSKMNI